MPRCRSTTAANMAGPGARQAKVKLAGTGLRTPMLATRAAAASLGICPCLRRRAAQDHLEGWHGTTTAATFLPRAHLYR